MSAIAVASVLLVLPANPARAVMGCRGVPVAPSGGALPPRPVIWLSHYNESIVLEIDGKPARVRVDEHMFATRVEIQHERGRLWVGEQLAGELYAHAVFEIGQVTNASKREPITLRHIETAHFENDVGYLETELVLLASDAAPAYRVYWRYGDEAEQSEVVLLRQIPARADWDRKIYFGSPCNGVVGPIRNAPLYIARWVSTPMARRHLCPRSRWSSRTPRAPETLRGRRGRSQRWHWARW